MEYMIDKYIPDNNLHTMLSGRYIEDTRIEAKHIDQNYLKIARRKYKPKYTKLKYRVKWVKDKRLNIIINRIIYELILAFIIDKFSPLIDDFFYELEEELNALPIYNLDHVIRELKDNNKIIDNYLEELNRRKIDLIVQWIKGLTILYE